MASTANLDFEGSKDSFAHLIERYLLNENQEASLKQFYTSLASSDVDKKAALDQALREKLCTVTSLEDKAQLKIYTQLLNLAANSVQNDMCTTVTLFVMLSDLFDTVTMEQCDEIFRFVEDRVNLWKLDIFYNAGKNYLLRMCNDLLRRLSKSQNTVFCGRIQLFLARLFPLEEKSGLNLTSQFNIDNVTTYNTNNDETTFTTSTKPQVSNETSPVLGYFFTALIQLLFNRNSYFGTSDVEAMEDGEMLDNTGRNIPIDYNLYKKFWSLQDFFRRPTQCYERLLWKTFTNYADEVLDCFSSYKLDDVQALSTRRKPVATPSGPTSAPSLAASVASERRTRGGEDMMSNGMGLIRNIMTSSSSVYFAKYLTSEKLLDLQLSDSNFRRYVLVQFLILFQYFNSQIKFKTPQQTLTEEQSVWVKNMSEKVVRNLSETPPDGVKFAQTIEHILSREEFWSAWKNDGCPSFIRKREDAGTGGAKGSVAKSSGAILATAKKRSIGEDIKLAVSGKGPKVVKMGNAELTRLWNLCPDNMAACRSPKRNFLPSVEEYFEEAIEQSDPSGGIEEQYKLVNNSTFAWKSLRLLARKSPYFFAQQQPQQQQQQQTGQPPLLSQYLNNTIAKLAKELTQTTNRSPDVNIANIKTEVVNDDNVTTTTAAMVTGVNGVERGNTSQHGTLTARGDEEEGQVDTLDHASGSDNESMGGGTDDEEGEERERRGVKEEVDDSDEEPSSTSRGGREVTSSQESGGGGVGAVGPLVTVDQLKRLASLMSEENWRQFARLVQFNDSDIEMWLGGGRASVGEVALKMLMSWKEINGAGATVSELRDSLSELSLDDLAVKVLGPPPTLIID